MKQFFLDLFYLFIFFGRIDTHRAISVEYLCGSSINISNIGGASNQIVNSVSPTCFGLSDGSASVAASGGAPPYEYLWIPGGQTTPAISNISSGNYYLEIIDDNGCLLVVPVSVSDPSEIKIVMPP